MSATLSASGGAGKVTLSGSGYAGAQCVVTVAFSATGRRYNEMRTVPVASGSVSADVTVPYAGTVTVTAVNPTNWTVLATSSQVSTT